MRRITCIPWVMGGALAFIVLTSAFPPAPEWGFFGHRRLNRLAVFTLDPDMMPFFRGHIEYLTEHAVDPDKRRYASPHEAVRHYMDLDHWDDDPTFPDLPRDWTDALIRQSRFSIAGADEVVQWSVDSLHDDRVFCSSSGTDTLSIALAAFRAFAWHNLLPDYYEEEVLPSVDSLRFLGLALGPADRVRWTEGLSEHGILPYHLQDMHRRLTRAFIDEDADRILRLSAEFGHYLGDAHVPLHTTENYNGQLTGQTGIHAFWESRLPELFADAEYDYLVGRAEYIDDPESYYWGIVLDSHALVDSVLNSERRLRDRFPQDQQSAFEERSGKVVRLPSTEFSRAWQSEMNGMVEERFRAAIRSIGSAWYSCWVDAGQPVLDHLIPDPRLFAPRDSLPRGTGGGRVHE